MLYDPKWQKTAPSLEGLISWLETKDPSATYQWSDCEGTCLIGQYGASIGLSWDDLNRRDEDGSDIYRRLSTNNAALAYRRPHTFGGALARARLAFTRTGSRKRLQSQSGINQSLSESALREGVSLSLQESKTP